MKPSPNRNPVAKFANLFNKASVVPNKKRRYTRLKGSRLLQEDA